MADRSAGRAASAIKSVPLTTLVGNVVESWRTFDAALLQGRADDPGPPPRRPRRLASAQVPLGTPASLRIVGLTRYPRRRPDVGIVEALPVIGQVGLAGIGGFTLFATISDHQRPTTSSTARPPGLNVIGT